jgi:hypothetical protein
MQQTKIFIKVTILYLSRFISKMVAEGFFFYPFSYPYPTKWGWYNMFSSCCAKDLAIIFTTGLPDVNSLETVVSANDCKCN